MTRRSHAHLAGAVALLAAFALMGCASTSEQESEVVDTGSEWQEAPTPVGEPETETPVGSVQMEFQTVYFDFDRFEIRSDARPVLRDNASSINQGSNGEVTIEGHCDERGSTEYNLALGERRANAVKRYLVDLGVTSARIRTVSFGEDRPAVQGHDESAWRYNRRADFTATN